MNWTMHRMDTYTPSLTQGSGDFPTRNDAAAAMFYRADGYHMVDKTPGFAMAGVTAGSSHTVIAAQVTVRAKTVPAKAAFGPFVMSKSGGAGYWLSVDRTGTATLDEIDANGDVWVITSAKAPPLGGGMTRTLMLTCTINLDRSVRLGGYVDGKRVISGTPAIRISSVTATGMLGHIRDSAPAEWVATKFARLGPDDTPQGS